MPDERGCKEITQMCQDGGKLLSDNKLKPFDDFLKEKNFFKEKIKEIKI